MRSASGEEATGPVHSSGALQGTKTPASRSAVTAQGCSGGRVTEQEAAVAALGGRATCIPRRQREGGAGKVAVVAEEVGCQRSDQLTEAAVRRYSLSLASRPPCLCRAHLL